MGPVQERVAQGDGVNIKLLPLRVRDVMTHRQGSNTRWPARNLFAQKNVAQLRFADAPGSDKDNPHPCPQPVPQRARLLCQSRNQLPRRQNMIKTGNNLPACGIIQHGACFPRPPQRCLWRRGRGRRSA